MRAKLFSVSSPLCCNTTTRIAAATVSRHVIRCPEPPWAVPQPKHAPPHSPEGLLLNPHVTATPMSLRLIKLRKQSEKLASEARANVLLDPAHHGSVGSAVWSLACLLEDVEASAAPAPADAARALRDGRWCLVWLFQKVFSASPNLAVGLLALTAEFVARSTESLIEENVESGRRRLGYERILDYELLIKLHNGRPSSIVLSNYAQFLYQYEKDFDRAKEYFELSVKAEPADAEVLSRYAVFLWRQRGDTGTADEMFLQAIAVDPENSYHRENYALFLQETGGADACHPLNDNNLPKNEEATDKELQAQSWSDIGILETVPEKRMLGNDCSTQYIRRKITYERTIIGGTANSLILSNYAQLLYQYGRDFNRADYYFKLAVASEPADAEAMGKYALFLWQGRGDVEAAEEMFLNATATDPENHHYQSNYAWFLWETGATDTCYPLDDCGVDNAEGEEDDIDNDEDL